MVGFSYEKRALKRPRLGPPDVYPQDPKQKEDELTAVNVKQGFCHTPQLSDEFGTAKQCNLNASKVSVYFSGIVNKKKELNTLSDTGRKRQQINAKDNFWPVTGRSKNAVEAWFKDLAGSKPLTNLAKKVPIFNKKEEIFLMLCEYQVPMLRAAWFLKMTSAYSVAISEAKIKKRHLPDPSEEWSQNLIKFLKDQLQKLQEYYHASFSTNSSSTNTGTSPTSINSSLQTEEQKLALKNWKYFIQLCKHLYDDGLLDRQEFLQWILELIEKTRSPDDGILRLLLPLVLQYLDEIILSEILSRKLAYQCCKKLSMLLADSGMSQNNANNSNGSLALQTSNQGNTNSLQVTMNEYMNCSFHRSVLLRMSTILQVITLECSTALVWSNVSEGKSLSILNGSPLDLLPCPPSALPMPQRPSNGQIRSHLRQAEEHIRQRGRAAEARWSCDKWQQSTAGTTIYRVLNALDALDRHCFDKVDANNSVDTLYAKVFQASVTKEHGTEGSNQDDYIVQLLCEWASSAQRSGEHRAMAVAKLLEKRQADLTFGEPDATDEKDSVSSITQGSLGLPMFQPLLMKFLDTDAPVLDDSGSPQNRTMFTNLVHLFAELIRHDVFSHDAYMCTLISRGDLLSGSGPSTLKPLTPGMCDLKTEDHGRNQDYDDSKIDDDLDKLLQHIREEQQNSMDIPDSPKDDIPSSFPGVTPITGTLEEKMENREFKRQSRHLLYTTHFPLPQDDSCTHESNQRHVLLYGVGRARDEARHTVKKISKEIYKLFSKKFSIDVAEGGKVKKNSKGEFNFESTMQKIQSLSFFDQHVVTMQCALAVVEMLNSFSSGSSNYLPVQEHVSFLFDLMELAVNIHGLIDTCIQMLKELPEVEMQLAQKGSALVRTYTTSLSLYIVGILRRYHCCFLLSQEQTASVFEGLCKVVKHVSNPADCSSSERCILAQLYDLYTSCSFLKSKHYEARCEPFANAYPKIKQTLYSSVQPSHSAGYTWNSQFMADYITNPRRKLELQYIKQLNENAGSRYCFVCNAVISACNETDNDKLNDLAILCAELTACCNSLSCEWLGVLTVLSSPSNRTSYFAEVLAQVHVQDTSIHNSLAVFTSILIARHCFSLQDFVVHVAVPSLLKAWNQGHGEAEGEAEAGARLTCHLLLRLFKSVEGPQPSMYSSSSPHPLPNSNNQQAIKLSCDRHLLGAAHSIITVGAVLAVLKAILVLRDVSSGDSKTKKDHAKPGMGELSISHILGTSDILGGGDDSLLELGLSTGKSSTAGVEGAPLSKFAKHALQQICCQEWVHERFLQNPEELCKQDMLLDSMLSPKQAQRLLHMICYPESAAALDETLDQRQWISRILENLDQWSLRVSWLDLQLMYKQFPTSSSEINQWLDMVAKATLDIFQLTSEEPEANGRRCPNKSDSKGASPPRPKIEREKSGSIWLVAPLVSKLPTPVQGRVLKMAGQVLESGNWSSSRGRDKDRSVQRSSSLLSHQPFLSLVLTCLKGQDDQREGLLTSLHSQLSQFLFLPKDEKLYNYDDVKAREMMQHALMLRFSLVGGMFDTIQRNITTVTDWSILLVQLVIHGVIDLNNNCELFTTVVDMLATLIHSTLICDTQSEKTDDARKHYQNLMKKLKKELADKHSPSIKHLRQLLPLLKQQSEVITCEPLGLLTDTKGNKIADFDCIDKKEGLQVADKQKVSPWDLLEGHKNPAPLSWSWFGAVRMERKTQNWEDAHRLLRYHTHSLMKPPNHYLDPPPLPPEDLEPPPEKQPKEEVKADTPNSDQSPRGKRQKAQRRRRQKAGMMNNQNVINNVATPPVQHMSYQNQNMYQSQPQWSYGQQQQQQYYSQQLPPVGGPRFERPINQSKQALSNMLRSRNPTAQFMGGQPAPFQNMTPRQQQFMRQQIRMQPNQAMQQGQQGLFPQQIQQSVGQSVNNPNMYSNMQQGMNQGYGGYGHQTGMVQQQMVSQPNQAMMSHGGFPQTGGFPQQHQHQHQAQGMMPGMQRQPDQATAAYMNQPMMQQRPTPAAAVAMAQQTRPPYMQAPNVTMGNMGGPMGPQQQGGYGRPVQQSMQPNQQQFQQQVRMRQQQMMAMQPPQGPQGQQQQNPQQQGAQVQTPQLVSHLQRSMPGSQQMGQHNPYHQNY